MSQRPVYLQTHKKFGKRMPHSLRRMFKRRPRVVIATYEDDVPKTLSDRKQERAQR
jgi:hypothetical protein